MRRAAHPRIKEDDLQAQIVQALHWTLPGAVIHHSANQVERGGKRAMMEVARKKRMGMLPGFPDLLLFWRGHALLIEVKTPSGRLSEAQKALHARLEAQGWPVHVCRSVDDALALARGVAMPSK